MSELYIQLLDATIRQVEQMKTRGTKHISLTPGLLDDLKKPAPARTRAATPAPTPASAPVARAVAPAKSAPAPDAAVVPASPAKVVTTAAKLAPEVKAVAFAALRKRVLACEKCPHLVTSRKSVVFGVGDMNASLMFVGEAPGADEDLQGEPFIGKAGQLRNAQPGESPFVRIENLALPIERKNTIGRAAEDGVDASGRF